MRFPKVAFINFHCCAYPQIRPENETFVPAGEEFNPTWSPVSCWWSDDARSRCCSMYDLCGHREFYLQKAFPQITWLWLGLSTICGRQVYPSWTRQNAPLSEKTANAFASDLNADIMSKPRRSRRRRYSAVTPSDPFPNFEPGTICWLKAKDDFAEDVECVAALPDGCFNHPAVLLWTEESGAKATIFLVSA